MSVGVRRPREERESVESTRTSDESRRDEFASARKLIWRSFKKHVLAVAGGVILLFFYLIAVCADVIAPYPVTERHGEHPFAPPQRIHVVHEGRLSAPFVYGYSAARDPESRRMIFQTDTSQRYPIRLLVPSKPYKLLGLFTVHVKLFGVREGHIYLFGTDELGRDLLSRTVLAFRVSLTVGLVGVALSFVLGLFLGGISGYYGGTLDVVIQRTIELLLSIPKIPLFLALAAALPRTWSPVQVYFGVTLILSSVGWGGLARVIRGKFLELRESDFVTAAKIAGATDGSVIRKHLVPSFMSYIIVDLTLSVPRMILAETSLSFLGLGIRSPAVSWGALLTAAQKVHVLVNRPWLLIPAVFVIATVLCFNFVGDGLRDAADPYRSR